MMEAVVKMLRSTTIKYINNDRQRKEVIIKQFKDLNDIVGMYSH